MPPKVEFEQIDEHGSMVHSVISCSLGFHGKGCCDPSTIGGYTLSFNRLYFFVLYSAPEHARAPPAAADHQKVASVSARLSLRGRQIAGFPPRAARSGLSAI